MGSHWTATLLTVNLIFVFYLKEKKSLEKQANKIVRSVCQGTKFESDIPKLLTNGSNTAKFKTFIKDHKSKVEQQFLLRPIASVVNTPTEKVDWLVCKVISQLVNFVPAHLKNMSELIEIVNNLDRRKINSQHVFLSLDVNQLYPSIPISAAITAVMKLAEAHWSEIDNKGLKIQDLQKCLNFVSFNYEIEYKDKFYRQKRGCPMGAHYASIFAIIFMDSIETEALRILKLNHDFEPIIYKRYVDDIILGPLPPDPHLFDMIKSVFNSIDKSIQFTLDSPGPNGKLNFLNLSIYLENNTVHFDWYRKDCHSGITLRNDSWVPQSI